jgi:hypothetical protein
MRKVLSLAIALWLLGITDLAFPREKADSEKGVYRICNIKTLTKQTVITIAIPNPEKKYEIDNTTSIELWIKGQKDKLSAKGILFQGQGFMGSSMVSLVPLDKCRIIIEKERVRVLGFVPLDMSYNGFQGIRYEKNELLIPVVFKTDVKTDQIECVVLFDNVITYNEKNSRFSECRS